MSVTLSVHLCICAASTTTCFLYSCSMWTVMTVFFFLPLLPLTYLLNTDHIIWPDIHPELFKNSVQI